MPRFNGIGGISPYKGGIAEGCLDKSRLQVVGMIVRTAAVPKSQARGLDALNR